MEFLKIHRSKIAVGILVTASSFMSMSVANADSRSNCTTAACHTYTDPQSCRAAGVVATAGDASGIACDWDLEAQTCEEIAGSTATCVYPKQ